MFNGNGLVVLDREKGEELAFHEWETRYEVNAATPIVMDDSTCVLSAMRRVAHFYAHESCGQCVQCREGTAWITKILHRIELGDGEMKDLDTLYHLCEQLTGRTICVLADSVTFPLRSALDKFRDEFEAHILRGECTAR